MMKDWAPMEVEDALQLLSPAFSHPQVSLIYSIYILADPNQSNTRLAYVLTLIMIS
jgi:hypothetical protein